MVKKAKTDFSRLTPEQSAFVVAKVRSLGSVEAVNQFYNTDSLVDKFARLVARMQFLGAKK
jgi:hypothetical protein